MNDPRRPHVIAGSIRRGWLIVSALLGAAALAFGVAAIGAPGTAATIYGLGAPRDPVWVRSAGVRDISLGFALLATIGLRNDTGVVAMLLGLAIIGLGDAILVWNVNSGFVAAHVLHVGGCLFSIALSLVGLRMRASKA